MNEVIQSYVIILLIDIRLPVVSLYIIRNIVDTCEREKDIYVKDQIKRFKNGLEELLSNTTLSIEQNMLEVKVDYYKGYFFPREKNEAILSVMYRCSLKQ
nr:hypothetical protein [Staphylococcus delphini]